MKTEIFPESLTTKKAKAEREKIEKFIDYYHSCKGVTPSAVSINREQMEALTTGMKAKGAEGYTIKNVELKVVL